MDGETTSQFPWQPLAKRIYDDKQASRRPLLHYQLQFECSSPLLLLKPNQ
jgi:hypothetical protein